MLCTALIAVSKSGKKHPTKIRKIDDKSPTPKPEDRDGDPCEREMGRKIWINGLNAISPRTVPAECKPKGIAMMVANTNPHVTRKKK